MFVGTFCCYNEPENPCTICPNGVTAAQGDDYAPFADSGDTTTCAQYIEWAASYESGSYVCGYYEIDEIPCCPTEPEDACIICPNGATVGGDFIPGDEGSLTCNGWISLAAQFETGSSFCGEQGEWLESECCPTVINPSPTPVTPSSTPMPVDDTSPTFDTISENQCILCPNGVTASEGEDYAPYAESGNFTTCAELVEDYKLIYESGSFDCAFGELVVEALCCYTPPENPCTICPDGVTVAGGDDFIPYPSDEGDSLTCVDWINFALYFDSESDYCGVVAEMDESTCCPFGLTRAPSPMPLVDTPVTITTTSSTSAAELDNPCIICPDGATAGDDFIPNASSGNSMTCSELISSFMAFEAGSQMCAFSKMYRVSCCPTATAPTPAVVLTTPDPTPAPDDDTNEATTTTASTLDSGVDNPCIICPDGITEGMDDVAPYANNEDFRTCAQIVQDALSVESGTGDCGYAELRQVGCCYAEPANPCNICPNGATAGDDYVHEYEENTMTCKDLIDSAMYVESGSDACALYDIDMANCCPPEPEETPAPTATEETPAPTTTPVDDTPTSTTTTSSNLVADPCIICPNGVTAGYEDVKPGGAGETKTCKDMLDGMVNVTAEAGSDLCESMSEIEVLCCPVIPSVSPTDRNSGGASVLGKVGLVLSTILSTMFVFVLV